MIPVTLAIIEKEDCFSRFGHPEQLGLLVSRDSLKCQLKSYSWLPTDGIRCWDSERCSNCAIDSLGDSKLNFTHGQNAPDIHSAELLEIC
jgi:hypothetical protein